MAHPAASPFRTGLKSGTAIPDYERMKVLRITGFFLLWVVAILSAVWAFGALYFDFPLDHFGKIAAALFVLLLVAVVVWIPGNLRKLASIFAGFFLVLCWWLTLRPTNDRKWQPDVAQLGWAEISGDEVTVHNVRNFDYQTETDFKPRWETRTVQLSGIMGMDLAIAYWGSVWAAHPIVSFRFRDAPPLCFSIETRKAVGQSYSALRGFFRQFTLVYVVAEERDVIRVRSNYRPGEEVYLYRTTAPPARARATFLEYLDSMNALREHPRWYNAVTSNCTTNIRTQGSLSQRLPWDWRLLLNGKADEMLYERHNLVTGGLPFAELKQRSLINPSARAADHDPDFWRRIREGLPEGN